MEELKQAALCTLLEELTTLYSLFDEHSGAEEYAEARSNAAQCIRILNEIGMPKQAILPKDRVDLLSMDSTERFLVQSFRMANDDAKSKVLDILKKPRILREHLGRRNASGAGRIGYQKRRGTHGETEAGDPDGELRFQQGDGRADPI